VCGQESKAGAYYIKFDREDTLDYVPSTSLWNSEGGLLLSSTYLVPIEPDGSLLAPGLERLDDE